MWIYFAFLRLDLSHVFPQLLFLYLDFNRLFAKTALQSAEKVLQYTSVMGFLSRFYHLFLLTSNAWQLRSGYLIGKSCVSSPATGPQRETCLPSWSHLNRLSPESDMTLFVLQVTSMQSTPPGSVARRQTPLVST